MGCLVLLVLAFAGGIWAYFEYFHDRALENAGQNLVVLEKVDPDVKLSYLRRMRDPLLPKIGLLGKEVRALVLPLTGGKKSPGPKVEEDIKKLEDRCRQAIGDVNAQGVPKGWVAPHRSLALSVGGYWKSLVYLREGLKAEDPAQARRFFIQSRQELTKAGKAYQVTVAAIKRHSGQP